jgi:arginase family enzyme
LDLQIYLQPISDELFTHFQSSQLGRSLNIHTSKKFPDLTNTKLVIIGVCEGRKSINNKGSEKAPDKIREYLYSLFKHSGISEIADLGNVQQGFEISDTYYALSNIVTFLIKKKIIPIIIGGGQDLTYANYTAYQNLEQTVNLVSIDSVFDMGLIEQPIDNKSYLGSIILHQPNYLFNYSNIGYQTYLVSPSSINMMNKLYFDSYRLGQIRDNIQESEPIIRHADMLSFDFSAIKHSDAPANEVPQPNGFYAEEACQMMRYAGMNDKLSSVGLYEINPSYDERGKTSHLAAQMIWCFVDGFYNRKREKVIQS